MPWTKVKASAALLPVLVLAWPVRPGIVDRPGAVPLPGWPGMSAVTPPVPALSGAKIAWNLWTPELLRAGTLTTLHVQPRLERHRALVDRLAVGGRVQHQVLGAVLGLVLHAQLPGDRDAVGRAEDDAEVEGVVLALPARGLEAIDEHLVVRRRTSAGRRRSARAGWRPRRRRRPCRRGSSCRPTPAPAGASRPATSSPGRAGSREAASVPWAQVSSGIARLSRRSSLLGIASTLANCAEADQADPVVAVLGLVLGQGAVVVVQRLPDRPLAGAGEVGHVPRRAADVVQEDDFQVLVLPLVRARRR